MMPTPSWPRGKRAALTVLGSVLALAVTGCTATTVVDDPTTTAATRLPFPAVTEQSAITFECGDLDDALDGWTLATNLSPATGTPAAAAASAGGVGCVFVDDSSDRLVVAVASITDDSVTAVQSFLVENGAVETDEFGNVGYFEEATGDAESFEAQRWISIVSSTITTSDEAASLLATVTAAVDAQD